MATEVYTVKEPLYGPYKLYSGEPFEAAQEKRNRIGKQERTNRCRSPDKQLYRSRNEEWRLEEFLIHLNLCLGTHGNSIRHDSLFTFLELDEFFQPLQFFRHSPRHRAPLASRQAERK